MHKSSQIHMEWAAEQYLNDSAAGVVVDVGSSNIGGTYRDIFTARGWQYRGVDLEPGENVDVVMPRPYALPFSRGSVDLVISGQAIEHMLFPWVCVAEMARVLRLGGMLFLIGPSKGYIHRYPVDCWRFYPDGFVALAAWAGLEVLHVATDLEVTEPSGGSEVFGDTVGIFRKGGWSGLRRRTVHRICRAAANYLHEKAMCRALKEPQPQC